MKKLLFILLAIVPLRLTAADITQGHIFQPGEQNITHVEMNAIVGSATINTTFFTDKAALAPVAADVFLYYSAANAAYRKATLTQLLLANTLLITSQSADTSPSGTDLVLTYDGVTFRKVTIQDLIGGTTNFMQTFPEITTPLLTDYLPLSEGSSNRVVTVSNFLALTRTTFDYAAAFTNLLTHTAPTNLDKLLIWDSTTSSNKQTTLIGLVTNLPTISSMTATDLIVTAHSGTNLSKVTLNTLSNAIAGNLLTSSAKPVTFTSPDFTLPGVGTVTNYPHGLAGTPQSVRWVLKCVTADLEFVPGDEVSTADFFDTGGLQPTFVCGVNATNVFLIQANNARTFKKDGSGPVNITAASWNAKAYAIYFP